MDSKKAIQQALENWRDLKYGMFIHFGLYSILAGEWEGETVKGLGEWLQCKKKIPNRLYSETTKRFNPIHWNPEEIVSLAHKAGMRYLVITAKHHDGFALFDTQVSDFSIGNTPYQKDLLKPLVEACRRYGILPCFYYSQDLDWNDPDGGGNNWDFEVQNKNFPQYLERKVKPQLKELLTQYGEIGLIWFDVPVTLSLDQSRELADYVHQLQPRCLVNGRIGHGCGDFENLGDNQVPGGRSLSFAETAGTLNDCWGYTNADQNWKTPRELIIQLCELASKGVNYLLNIGPDGMGRVPQETKHTLTQIGQWMDRCGVAIYQTEPNPFPLSFPWGVITMRGNTIYLLLTQSTATNLEMAGILHPPHSARFLGFPEDSIQMSWDKGLLRLEWTSSSEPLIPVIELVFEEQVRLDTRLGQLPNGMVVLPAHLSRIVIEEAEKNQTLDFAKLPEDIRVQYESKIKLWGDKRPHPWLMQHECGGYIENWRSTKNYIEWTFFLQRPGRYDVYVSSVSSKYTPWEGCHRAKVMVDEVGCEGYLFKDTLIDSPRSRYYPENSCKLGAILISRTGTLCLKLWATEILLHLPEGFAITEIKLIPQT